MTDLASYRKKPPDGYFQKKNSLNATLVADKAQEEHSTP